MGIDAKLDIAGHVLSFTIWVSLLVVAFRLNQISFLMTTVPLLGLIGSLIFHLIKIGRRK